MKKQHFPAAGSFMEFIVTFYEDTWTTTFIFVSTKKNNSSLIVAYVTDKADEREIINVW